MQQPSSLSIVVASFSSARHLEACLTSLEINVKQAEIIVSTCLSEEDVEFLRQSFEAIFVFNPDETKHESARLRETRVFRLRSSGIKVASGEIVLLLEDHCEVTSTWLKEMLNALLDPGCIAGGPITNGVKKGLYHWALYWSEYAAMMPPFPKDQAKYLSAVNSGYYKSTLDACTEVWQDGFYDNEVHDAMIEQGAKLCLAENAVVVSSLPFTFTQAFVHLFTGGQRYGAYRGGGHWNMQRVVRLFATFLVPMVLSVRVIKIVRLRQPQLLLKLFMASPILYILFTAWGMGEFVGTMRGDSSTG